MTNPYIPAPYGDPGSQQEKDYFDRLYRERLEQFTSEAQTVAHAVSSAAVPNQPSVIPQGAPQSSSGLTPPRPKHVDELLAQAAAWGISNAEQMDLNQLEHEINQRRNLIPRDQQTSLQSAGMAAAGFATALASGTTHLLGNILGSIEEIPFAGHVTSQLLRLEKAKYFMYDVSKQADMATEITQMYQPEQDRGAARFLTAAGTMAGYVLPGILAWEAMAATGAGIAGASARYVPSAAAWAGRVTTPFMRAALQGGSASALMEVGSDETTAEKTQNIMLGTLLGGLAGFGGKTAVATGLGAIGAGIGGIAADDKHKALGAVMGAGAGVAAAFVPELSAKLFSKVAMDIPTPWQTKFNLAEAAGRQRLLAEPDVTYEEGNLYNFRNGNESNFQWNPSGADPTYTGPVRNPDGSIAGLFDNPVRRLGPGDGATLPSGPAEPPMLGAGSYGMPARSGPASFDPVRMGDGSAPEPFLRSDAQGEVVSGYTGEPGTQLPPSSIRGQLMSPERAALTGSEQLAVADMRGSSPENRLFASDALPNIRGQLYGQPPQPNEPFHLLQSKTRDAQGRLLILHHGTNADFQDFDLNFLSDESLAGPGIYTTTDYRGTEWQGAITGGHPDVNPVGYARQPEVALNHNFAPGVDPELALDAIYNRVNDAEVESGGYAWQMDRLNALRAVRQANPGYDHSATPQFIGSTFSDEELAKFAPEITREEVPVTQPNVRMMRLDIRKPLYLDHEYSLAELRPIVDKLNQAVPEFNWDEALATHEKVANSLFGPGESHTVTGWDFMRSLWNVTGKNPVHGVIEPPPFGNLSSTPEPGDFAVAGPRVVNRSLYESDAIDGFMHKGGVRSGIPPHDVWIALDPSQVHSPWDLDNMSPYEAIMQGAQMSKQASVMESNLVGEAAGKLRMNDSDVAAAMKSSNPAGVSVLKNVAADQPTISQMLFEHPEIQFVEREGRLDALLGNVTPEQVKMYSDFGVFPRQQVHDGYGTVGEVVALRPVRNLNNEVIKHLVQIKTANGMFYNYNPEELLPTRFSGVQELETPDLWNSFKADFLRQVNDDFNKAQMPPALSLMDERLPSMMGQHMEQFLDNMGVYDPALRQIVDHDFNSRWVSELRDLDPESKALQENAARLAMESHNQRIEEGRSLPVPLEQKAHAKGFIWLTDPRTGGGIMRDMANPMSGLEIPLDSESAAEAFLQHVDRVLPDLSETGNIPPEIVGVAPSETTITPDLPHAEYAETLSEEVRRLEGYVNDIGAGDGGEGGFGGFGDDGAGGFSGGGGGNDGSGAPIPPPDPNRPPVWAPDGTDYSTNAQQFAAKRADPRGAAEVARLTQKLISLTGTKLRYTRYGMLNVQEVLYQAGLTAAKAWEHYEALATAHTIAFKDAYPWIKRYDEIMREFHPTAKRHGDVVRIHAIEDPAVRMEEYAKLRAKHDISPAWINRMQKADAALKQFMFDFHYATTGDAALADNADRDIFQFLQGARAKQAAQRADAFEKAGVDPSHHYLVDQLAVRDKPMATFDPQELGQYMIRSKFFQIHELEPWNNLMGAWDLGKPMIESASPIPLALRQYMLDYATLSRYGYDASKSMAVQGVKNLFSTVGIKLSRSEAARIMGIPQTLMHMSMLAGRSAIFFRDTSQVLFALTKVRVPHLASTIADTVQGQNWSKLREIYQRGLDGGWIEQENPNVEGLYAFHEQGVELPPDPMRPDLPTQRLGIDEITDAQAARREALAKLMDKTADMPDWLVNLMLRPEKSGLNTLKWYAAEGRINRMLVGESAYRQATQELTAYRRSLMDAALQKNPALAMRYEEFANNSFFSSFEKPIQRKLAELVQQGNDDEAAKMFAREVANFSQFRYGRKEQMPALRSNLGSWAFTFSNYTGQSLEMLNSILRNGTMPQKVRAGAVLGTLTLGLKMAKNQTGWSFDKWGLGGTLDYQGGPLLQVAVRDAAALWANQNEALGRPVDEMGRGAQSLVDREGWLPFGDFNPWSGYGRTADELVRAAGGVNPIEHMARYTITGDRGSRIEIQRQMEEWARHMQSGMDPNLAGQQVFQHGELSPNGGTMQPPQSNGGWDFLGPASKHPGSGAQY